MTQEKFMRTFFAVPVEGESLARLRMATKDCALPPGWHWMPEANWHMTLYFTGYRTAQHIEHLVAAANRVLAQETATTGNLSSWGAFPFAHEISILLVAEAIPSPTLSDLQTRLAEVVAPLSEHQDERPWRPHVTLARASHPSASPLTQQISIPFPVNEIRLYASERDHRGSRYQVLHSWLL